MPFRVQSPEKEKLGTQGDLELGTGVWHDGHAMGYHEK